MILTSAIRRGHGLTIGSENQLLNIEAIYILMLELFIQSWEINGFIKISPDVAGTIKCGTTTYETNTRER